MPKIFVGIDPGKKGGIAIINDSGHLLEVHPMPLFPSGEIDSGKIHDILDFPQEKIVLLEKSQSMPGQGVKSMFNYGRGYGKIQAVLEIGKYPYQEIAPQTWKKDFQLIGKDKSESITTACKLFPDMQDCFFSPRGAKLDGKAEAVLIAEYAKRHFI